MFTKDYGYISIAKCVLWSITVNSSGRPKFSFQVERAPWNQCNLIILFFGDIVKIMLARVLKLTHKMVELIYIVLK